MQIDSRAVILRRIREALVLKAPVRHLVQADATADSPQNWLPPVPENPCVLKVVVD